MESGLLSDAVIQNILQRSMEEKFSRTRPATRHFFNREPHEQGVQGAVSIHQWAIASVGEVDTRSTIKFAADRVVKEVAAAATKLTGELIFRKTHLLPWLPKWDDDRPLFCEDDRFGGPNIIRSNGRLAADISSAAQALKTLDPELDIPYERLLLFCAKPLEKELIKAAAKAQIPCKVFGVYHHKEEKSWVLTRDESPYSLVIAPPDFHLPVKGNKMVLGAKYTAWIKNPKNAVCVTPKE